MGFLRLADLFPDAPVQPRAEPESGVHKTAKKRKARAPAKPAKKKDEQRIPVLNVSPKQVRVCVEDARARWLVAFIDGTSSVERVLAASALAEEDARAGMKILLDEGLVALT